MGLSTEGLHVINALYRASPGEAEQGFKGMWG